VSIDALFDVLALVTWLIAALAPNAAALDRTRLVAAGLALAIAPVLYHAVQAH
jgi:hypothetical protein